MNYFAEQASGLHQSFVQHALLGRPRGNSKPSRDLCVFGQAGLLTFGWASFLQASFFWAAASAEPDYAPSFKVSIPAVGCCS